MPDQEAIGRAQKDAREGKSSSTQAGEFVREEMHHIREGKHSARSAKQAIAIGLSEARRAGVKLPPRGSSKTRAKARGDIRKGRTAKGRRRSRTRSRATLKALRREGSSAASRESLSRQGRSAAQRRTARARHRSAERAVHTKGKADLRRAAPQSRRGGTPSKVAARIRARHRRAA